MSNHFIPHLITAEKTEKNILIEVDNQGIIQSKRSEVDRNTLDDISHRISDDFIAIPGMVNAHSHAFQRLLRGPTQYRGPQEDSFWTWRKVMYAFLRQLSPDDIYTVTKHIYLEMIASGITHVGEFHYVHHQPDGSPYPDTIQTSRAVIAAAKDAGLRLTLLRTVYMRGDFDAVPEPQQLRFIDSDLIPVFRDIDALLELENNQVSVGVAPHSVRTVSPEALRELKSRYAHLPFHIHVSEQPRENEGCLKHYGVTPISLLEKYNCLDPKTVLVHATHVSEEDIQKVSAHEAQVCFCPSTEADLGDGIGPTREYLKHNVSLSLGTDGQTFSSLLEEARRLEMHERLRLGLRNALAPKASISSGDVCLRIATSGGQLALGKPENCLEIGQPLDFFTVNRNDPYIAGVTEDDLLNALIFSLPSSHIESTIVAGREVFNRHKSNQLEESATKLQDLRAKLTL